MKQSGTQQTGAGRSGAVTVLIALWLSLFCNHCLASAGSPADTDSRGSEHCQRAEVPQHQQDDGCDGQCGGEFYALQSHAPAEFTAQLFPAQEPVPGPPFAVSAMTTAFVQIPPTAYEQPARSRIIPFQRYTVLLN